MPGRRAVRETPVERDKTKREAYTKAVSNDSLFELLSPAGDEDCLYAAVSAGADAVYAGADRFGARAYAANFDTEGLIHALRYLHLFGKKLYLTLNTLIKEREYPELYDFIKPLYLAGLDGVIVQDTGVVRLLLREFPGIGVHASTQMSVSSVYGALLLKEAGVSRIVTSRELSLEEIREIIDKTGLEIECFIHGAMCYSYSGQCLMSSFLGGRSGNRGRCAGPCRQDYSAGKEKGAYLLSMKDLCTIDLLPALMQAGIRSFKIEGRMKSPGYVCGVTSIYRKYMDRYLSGGAEECRVEERDRERLISLYSRGGISAGYYRRRNGRDMITMTKGGYVREETEDRCPEKRRLPVRGRCRVMSGEPVLFEAEGGGTLVSASGPEVQPAKNRALTREDILRQLKKTGDSDFRFEELEVLTDGSSFLPVSALNALRRDALNKLWEELSHAFERTL